MDERNYNPAVFTENGIAMLSSVLHSDRAIEVNIMIMRLFTQLRDLKHFEENINYRIDSLESYTNQTFQLVFKEIDELRVKELKIEKKRKIGLKV